MTDTVDKQIEITIPAVDTTWQWEASSGSGWITPLASAGQSPATVAATLASTTLPAGIYTGTLDITLSHGDYQLTYPVTVRLTITGANLAVALASFTADAQADGIRIGWETTTEINNAGFNLYRAESASGPRVRLNAELIPSQAPGSTQGAVYTWLDVEVEAGQTTFYWIEDMDLSGATTLHGPLSATYQGPTAVGLICFAASQPKPAQTPGASAAAMPVALLVAGLVAAMGLWRWRAGRRI